VYLLSHLRGKKHQQAITDNHTGRELTRQEIVSQPLNLFAHSIWLSSDNWFHLHLIKQWRNV